MARTSDPTLRSEAGGSDETEVGPGPDVSAIEDLGEDEGDDDEGDEESWLLAAAAAPAIALKKKRSSEHLPAGTSVGPRYEVEGVLGAGGMGVVYRALDRTLGRSIALKMHHCTDDTARDRLLREAKVMAQLSHPNVLAVHEVGTYEDQVFLAAELVEGRTVRDWNKTPHPWREVVALYIDAGLGLAAAHAIGLVHRDFKPDNVLVGNDGRVRVADFGLARPAGTVAGGALQLSLSASTDGDISGSTPVTLTKTGARVGTPAYMAPEQFMGEELDGRADQFAFCVSLYESLYRRRPFPGRRPAAVAAAIGRGPVYPRDAKRVPRAVRQVVERGLQPEISQRFGSMDELIAALQKTAQPRSRWPWIAGAAVVGGGIVAAVQPQSQPDLCADAAQAFGDGWSPDRVASLEAAFSSDGAAQSGWQIFERAAQRYVDAWGQTREATCRDRTGITGDLKDRAYACLDGTRREFVAVLAALEQGGASFRVDALERIARVVQPHECTDASVLLADVSPPAQAAARPLIDALRDELAELRAGALGGMTSDEALARIDAIEADARPYEYGPLDTEVLLTRAEILRYDDPAAAVEILQDAYFAARAAGHRPHSAAAASQAANLVANTIGRPEPALLWGRLGVAEAAGGAVPLSHSVRAELILGIVYDTAGDWNKADATYRSALAKVPVADEAHQLTRAAVLVSLSGLEGARGRIDEAIAAGEEALMILERVHGGRSSSMIAPLSNIGFAMHEVGRYAEAYSWHERALQICHEIYGQEHHECASTLINIAVAAQEMGEDELAYEHYGDAERIFVARFGPQHPDVALMASNQAYMATNAGEHERAASLRKKALDVFEATAGPLAVPTLRAKVDLADSQRRAGALDEPCATFDAVAEVAAERVGASKALVLAVAGQADCAIERERLEEAIALLRKATRAADVARIPPEMRARIQLDLADALWEQGSVGKAPAREAALVASGLYQSANEAAGVRTVEDWLQEHPAPAP